MFICFCKFNILIKTPNFTIYSYSCKSLIA